MLRNGFHLVHKACWRHFTDPVHLRGIRQCGGAHPRRCPCASELGDDQGSVPEGSISEHQCARAADAAAIDIRSLIGAVAIDGAWNYEISFGQSLNEATRQAAASACAAGSSTAPAGLSDPLDSISGGFHVAAAQIVDRTASEPKTASARKSASSPNDQVIADDLIVQGEACVGIDCVNNESFGFDTLRLKENNLRIKFEVTSTGTFPATDWQLTANDTGIGGLISQPCELLRHPGRRGFAIRGRVTDRFCRQAESSGQ